MRTLVFVFFILTFGARAFACEIPKYESVIVPISKEKKEVQVELTLYGNAVVTFYTNGQVKKVKCKPPKNTICLVLTENAHDQTLQTYTGGDLSGTYTVPLSYSHSIDGDGDDIVEF